MTLADPLPGRVAIIKASAETELALELVLVLVFEMTFLGSEPLVIPLPLPRGAPLIAVGATTRHGQYGRAQLGQQHTFSSSSFQLFPLFEFSLSS